MNGYKPCTFKVNLHNYINSPVSKGVEILSLSVAAATSILDSEGFAFFQVDMYIRVMFVTCSHPVQRALGC